jgi:hypothetical protein
LEIVAGWRQRAGLRHFFNQTSGKIHIDPLIDRSLADRGRNKFIVAVIFGI